MSEEQYTLDDVRAWALYEIGIEGEDFIYRKDDREVLSDGTLCDVDCRYYIDGMPSCIVGRMLDRNGVIDAEKAATCEGMSARPLINSLAPGRFTDGALRFLTELQRYQDEGKTWGESYREALEYASL